jgi:hypothetical protein
MSKRLAIKSSLIDHTDLYGVIETPDNQALVWTAGEGGTPAAGTFTGQLSANWGLQWVTMTETEAGSGRYKTNADLPNGTAAGVYYLRVYQSQLPDHTPAVSDPLIDGYLFYFDGTTVSYGVLVADVNVVSVAGIGQSGVDLGDELNTLNAKVDVEVSSRASPSDLVDQALAGHTAPGTVGGALNAAGGNVSRPVTIINRPVTITD